MNTPDPFDFPEIRVKTPSQETPLRPAEEQGAMETRTETLTRQWLEAWTLKRDAETSMAALRREIETRLENGEVVGNSTGYVTWETSRRVKADPKGLYEAMGSKIFLSVIEVSSTKLRKLIDDGAVPEDAPWMRFETKKKLVTKLR